jgi:hypothetical protein
MVALGFALFGLWLLALILIVAICKSASDADARSQYLFDAIRDYETDDAA